MVMTCICGHQLYTHVVGDGACQGTDTLSDGWQTPCECRSFRLRGVPPVGQNHIAGDDTVGHSHDDRGNHDIKAHLDFSFLYRLGR